MSTNLIGSIADAIHAAECGCDGAGRAAEERQAKAAVKALTDDAFLANAVQALVIDGWAEKIGDDTTLRRAVDDLIRIARVVLGSVVENLIVNEPV
jgi:hypothetical protein